ncbi:MAG: hypothetical protein D6742_10030 [Cyanobacteria bacterium J069]|nr:MAG: hypothetical protein D6742_10030 [Cyanobacteria bacterium J069]
MGLQVWGCKLDPVIEYAAFLRAMQAYANTSWLLSLQKLELASDTSILFTIRSRQIVQADSFRKVTDVGE